MATSRTHAPSLPPARSRAGWSGLFLWPAEKLAVGLGDGAEVLEAALAQFLFQAIPRVIGEIPCHVKSCRRVATVEAVVSHVLPRRASGS